MKSKSTLSLIEQSIMALVLAVAAAVCLRVFVYADALSKNAAAADNACIQAQSAAETLKSCSGDLAAAAKLMGGSCSGDVWTVGYDKDWRQTDSAPQYTLTAGKLDSGIPGLGMARLSVCGPEELFSLDVCWQEAGGG